MYRLTQKTGLSCHYIIANNFNKCRLIFELLSPARWVPGQQCNCIKWHS